MRVRKKTRPSAYFGKNVLLCVTLSRVEGVARRQMLRPLICAKDGKQTTQEGLFSLLSSQ